MSPAEQPAHDLRVAGKQISSAVLIGGAALPEIVRVLDIQHQQPAELDLLGKIQAFFKSEEEQREFVEWKAQRQTEQQKQS